MKKILPTIALYLMAACSSPDKDKVKSEPIEQIKKEHVMEHNSNYESNNQNAESRTTKKPITKKDYYVSPDVGRAYKETKIDTSGNVDVYFTLKEDLIKSGGYSTHNAYGQYEQGVIRLSDKENDGIIDGFNSTRTQGRSRYRIDGSFVVDWSEGRSYADEKTSLDFFLRLTEKADSAGIGNTVNIAREHDHEGSEWKKVSKNNFYSQSFSWDNPSY